MSQSRPGVFDASAWGARRPLVGGKALFLAAALAAFGVERSAEAATIGSASQPIINGESCDETQSPETVAILPVLTVKVRNRNTVLNTVSCTGTLIAPDVVMAAGHCVDRSLYEYDLQQQGLELVSMEFYISYQADLTALSSGQSQRLPDDAVRVAFQEAHPEYSLASQTAANGPANWHDISLLYLDTAQTVPPAIVISRDESDQVVSSAPVTIVGWGAAERDVDLLRGREGVRDDRHQ